MKVRITAPAQADLEEIGDRIALDSPAAAERFVGELRQAASALATHPRRFPSVRSISGVRKKVHRRYLIFFRVEAGEVQILRIVHGSRDWAVLVRSM